MSAALRKASRVFALLYIADPCEYVPKRSNERRGCLSDLAGVCAGSINTGDTNQTMCMGGIGWWMGGKRLNFIVN